MADVGGGILLLSHKENSLNDSYVNEKKGGGKKEKKSQITNAASTCNSLQIEPDGRPSI